MSALTFLKLGNCWIINNEEHFEIWNDSLTVLITSYSTTFTYTLCDYASLSKKDIEHSSEIIKKIIYPNCNSKLKQL